MASSGRFPHFARLVQRKINEEIRPPRGERRWLTSDANIDWEVRQESKPSLILIFPPQSSLLPQESRPHVLSRDRLSVSRSEDSSATT